jgi:hypothetical protein
MAKKRKAKAKPKRKAAKPKSRPPTDPNEFAKWLVDRTTKA